MIWLSQIWTKFSNLRMKSDMLTSGLKSLNNYELIYIDKIYLDYIWVDKIYVDI